MANPKLLGQVTIGSAEQTFGFNRGGAKTADITLDTYDSILEVLAELEDQLQLDHADFSVSVSSLGIVSITNSTTAWTASWGTTDDALETLLGFAGTETVVGSGPYTLTASLRHQAAWYSPVGVAYPGVRRWMARKLRPLDDGDADVYGSTAEHKWKVLRFSTLLESQIEPEKAQVDDDGAGGTVDWTDCTFFDFWKYVNARKFRFYEDGSDGTVVDPGAEGDEFITCIRDDEETEPSQLDPDAWTWFLVDLPVRVVGS